MHVIQADAETKIKLRQAEIEWQTRVTATFLAALHPTEKGQAALQKAAENLTIAEPEPDSPTPSRADTPGDTRTLEEIMEQGNVQAALAHNMNRKGPGLPFM